MVTARCGASVGVTGARRPCQSGAVGGAAVDPAHNSIDSAHGSVDADSILHEKAAAGPGQAFQPAHTSAKTCCAVRCHTMTAKLSSQLSAVIVTGFNLGRGGGAH